MQVYARPRVNDIAGVRKVLGLKQYNEQVDLSQDTIKKIGYAVGENLGTTKKNKDGTYSKKQANKGLLAPEKGIFGKALDSLLMPVKTIQYSFYEGIGSKFGDQFATGLSQVLNDEMDISLERKGMVSGKAISYTAKEGIPKLKNDLSAVGDNFNDLRYAVEDKKVNELNTKFTTLFKSITKSITSIADSYLRGFRKGSIQLEALRKMEAEINKQDNQAIDLKDKDKIIYTVSGFAGEKGQHGHYMAEQLKPYVDMIKRKFKE